MGLHSQLIDFDPGLSPEMSHVLPMARFHIQLQTIEKLSCWKASGILIFQFVIRDMFETIICFIGFTIMSLYSRLARSLSSGSVVANARHPHPVLS